MLLDHTHSKLNSEITAIGGQYAMIREGTFHYLGKMVLYYVGCAVLDNNCCGSGGVCFARVPGFVHRLKYKTDQDDVPVSRIEPITDPTVQIQIRKILQDRESVHQVAFSS